MQENKIILYGVFSEFSPLSYPGRCYSQYEWDSIGYKWVVTEYWKKFEKELEITKRHDKINKIINKWNQLK